MKGVLVILDGVADLPVKQLNDKTPLEVADTPNLNFLANRGDLGLMNSVKPGRGNCLNFWQRPALKFARTVRGKGYRYQSC